MELLLGLLAALALSSLGVVPVGGDPDEVVGYCDNPGGCYCGEAITRRLADAEKEECGMRRCWGCPYFVPRSELEDAPEREWCDVMGEEWFDPVRRWPEDG